MMHYVIADIEKMIMMRTTACLYEVCDCTKFDTFQLNILKKKKVVTNIKFLSEDEVKDDALAWNCLNRHKYSKTD